MFQSNRLKSPSKLTWPLGLSLICAAISAAQAAGKWESVCARAAANHSSSLSSPQATDRAPRLIVHQCKAKDCAKDVCGRREFSFIITSQGAVKEVRAFRPYRKSSASLEVGLEMVKASELPVNWTSTLVALQEVAVCAERAGRLAPNWTLHCHLDQAHTKNNLGEQLASLTQFAGCFDACHEVSARRRTPRQVPIRASVQILDTSAGSGEIQLEQEDEGEVMVAPVIKRANTKTRADNTARVPVANTADHTSRRQQVNKQQVNKDRQLILVRVDQPAQQQQQQQQPNQPLVYVLGKGKFGRPALLLDLGQSSATSGNKNSQRDERPSERPADENRGRDRERTGGTSGGGSGGQSSGGGGGLRGGQGGEDSGEESQKANTNSNANTSGNLALQAVSLFERLIELTFFNITLFS